MVEHLSTDALAVLKTIARQVLGEPAERNPGLCLILQRDGPAPVYDPGEYRMFIDDGTEEFTYVCGFAAAPILELAALGLLRPCELEGDPREHWVLHAGTIAACQELKDHLPVQADPQKRAVH
jgi:hypothetical protein